MRRSVTHPCIFLSLIICAALTIFPASSSAQVRPRYPIIFDDFDYENESELTGANLWTDLDGGIIGNQQIWYKGNWDQVKFAKTAHLKFDTPGNLRLETEAGHYYTWLQGFLPPFLISGFVKRTGTWVARVRFDDIALGKITDSPLSLSFWVMSPNVVCTENPRADECRRTESRWSEFNHEWNNSFNAAYSQYLANGGVVDGEGTHTSAFFMRSPKKKKDVDLSCRRFTGDVQELIDDSAECMQWFVSNGDADRFADLLIQYDNNTLVFEAVAWKRVPSSNTYQGVIMRKSVQIGRLTQPMTTRFTLLGRTKEACERLNLVELSCWKQDKRIGFGIDWHFYTPATDIDIMDVVLNVNWLRDHRRSRVNTTGSRLDAPIRRPELTASLEDPSTNAAGEWVVVPSQRSTLYNRIKVKWSYRTKVDPSDSWSNWSKPVRGGYTYSPPINHESVHQLSVRATASDWYDSSNSITVTGCRIGNRYTEGRCDPLPESLVLGTNYPNPARTGTTITFELPSRTRVDLSIYDTLGRHMVTLLHDYRNQGIYSVYWNTNQVPSGLYFYEMKTDSWRNTKSIVVLK